MIRLRPLLLLAVMSCANAEPAKVAPVPIASAAAPKASAAEPIASAPIAPPPAPSASASTDVMTTPAPIVSASASTSVTMMPGPPPEPPIPATPLAGTVDGRPFEVKAALAVKDPDDATRRNVWLFDRPVACGAKLPPPGARSVEFGAPWQSGISFGSESMTGGARRSFTSVRGEVFEIAGTTARIVVRVRSNVVDVSGEVRPTACP